MSPRPEPIAYRIEQARPRYDPARAAIPAQGAEMQMMHKLKVIPEPKAGARLVLLPTPAKTPVMRGSGDVSHACGECEAHLIENIFAGQLHGTVIRCPECGSFNEL